MKRKRFPKFFLYFMIFSLLFAQSYPFYAAAQAEDTVKSTKEESGTNSDEDDSDKKEDKSSDDKDDKSSEESEKKDENKKDDEKSEKSDGEESKTETENKGEDSEKDVKADDSAQQSENDDATEEESVGESDTQSASSSSESEEIVNKDPGTITDLESLVDEALGEIDKEVFPVPEIVDEQLADDTTLNTGEDVSENNNLECECSSEESDKNINGENEEGVEEITEENDEEFSECVKVCSGTSIENTNEAVISDNVETVANTGENEQGVQNENDESQNENEEAVTEEQNMSDGIEGEGENQIQEGEAAQTETESGDATSVTFIKNDINTNAVGENGTYINADIYGDYTGDVNLLEIFQKIIFDAKAQNSSSSSSANTEIENTNNAQVENDVTTETNTGGNETEGSGDVETGDATSITDIANYVNTNIVGNNWLFAMLNVFRNWSGDLVVPGEGLFTTTAPRIFSNLNIINDNSADVMNNVETVSDTGNNSAGKENADIQTGDAVSSTSIVNIVNTNIIKNNWFLLLINNMGSWSGTLLNWGNEDASDTLAYDIGSYAATETSSAGSLSVHNYNNAQVENNVTTKASTGENTSSGQSSSAEVSTGNAFAFSNIFNMINTNIVGDNWFFGVVNNMGNWNGNVEFAYPDLDISIDNGLSKAEPSQTVDYSVHYKNVGKADSDSTKVSLVFPAGISAEETSWDLSGMKSGEEKTFVVKAKIAPDAKLDENLKVVAKVSTTTKEINLGNNEAVDETLVAGFSAENPVAETNNFFFMDYDSAPDSEISVKRSSNVNDQAKPGDRIENTIIVKNNGEGTVYNVYVKDKMLDGGGTELLNYSWPIGTIKEGGEIMIQYELLVNNPGQNVSIEYVAKAYGEDGFGEEVSSSKVSKLLTILGFVNVAEAATDERTAAVAEDVQVKGVDSPTLVLRDVIHPVRELLPAWIWFMSVIAFYLAINWALFPKKNNLLS